MKNLKINYQNFILKKEKKNLYMEYKTIMNLKKNSKNNINQYFN